MGFCQYVLYAFILTNLKPHPPHPAAHVACIIHTRPPLAIAGAALPFLDFSYRGYFPMLSSSSARERQENMVEELQAQTAGGGGGGGEGCECE